MPWIRTANVAMYEGADWSGFVKTVSGCTPQQAQRIAMADPSIRFFFFCREFMILTNPAWSGPRTFEPGDAVFFSGEPWFGGAPQCDSYQKDGLSLAYMGGVTETSPAVAAQFTTAQGLNAVDIVCLFGANLNLAVPDNDVRLAPDVPVPSGGTLAVAGSGWPAAMQESVATLQAQGIIVLITFVNNWDAAGWSNFDPTTTQGQQDAQNFALQLQSLVKTYGLDGIDIDDEYAKPDLGIPNSLAMVTSMIRTLMPDKILSKALWADEQYFGPTYDGVGLAQNLTYGWYMGYGSDPSAILPTYAGFGMEPSQLAMGYWTGQSAYPPTLGIDWMKSKGYAGYMTYATESAGNQALLGDLVNAWMGPGNWNETG
ncbi:MAG TPA: glycosyl hydrolase family 18 protein [Allosphingosinicella sp.]|jgi:hypothetical protein